MPDASASPDADALIDDANGGLPRLIAIMARLRDPERGCPWDVKQDFASIAPYTIEEAYEVADTIARGDMAGLRDELGDLLLQVVYHARMAEEAGAFDFADVARGIADKMVRRHPHVFGDDNRDKTAEQQTRDWERLKAAERTAAASALDGVAAGLPALTRAVKLQNRAARVGFDWPDAGAVLAKIAEETAELVEARDAGEADRLFEEYGDLMFVMANLARHLRIDPEAALRKANAKFTRRFHAIEAALAARGRTPADSTLAEMDALWDAAKAEEHRPATVRPAGAGMEGAFLPGLPVDQILAAYMAAPGNEVESGKFASPESSAALAANTFGLFLGRAADLPPLPGCESFAWPALSLQLEAIVRFPWRGGRHPCLDVLVETPSALIGIESKRYEPFRPKSTPALSDAYWKPVWGDGMRRYERIRDALRDGSLTFAHLDATQLVKHAFGLRTAVHRQASSPGKRPVLVYLYAEPRLWPDGRPVPRTAIDAHQAETRLFAEIVTDDEVVFRSCSYRELLGGWERGRDAEVRAHAGAIGARFAPY